MWVQTRWLSGHIELMSGTLQGLGLHDLGGEDARDKMLDRHEWGPKFSISL